jgi:hypothetical protein
VVPDGPQDDTMDDRATSFLSSEEADASKPANARQHGGDHYKGSGYEHWDLVLDTGQHYLQGCATKYVTRARKHEAGPRLNLLKAIHYVDKAQEADEAGRFMRYDHTYSVADVVRFGEVNGLDETETQIIKDIIACRWDSARQQLQQMLYSELE